MGVWCFAPLDISLHGIKNPGPNSLAPNPSAALISVRRHPARTATTPPGRAASLAAPPQVPPPWPRRPRLRRPLAAPLPWPRRP